MAVITETIGFGKNRLLRTSEFATSPWTTSGSGSTDANATNGPDGTLTADRLNATSTLRAYNQTVAASEITTGRLYTYSVWLKADTTTSTAILMLNNGINTRITLSWSGTTLVTATQSVTGGTPPFAWTRVKPDVNGNGWYRAQVTVSLISALTTVTIQPSTVNATGSVYAWGAQFEEAPYATSYLAVSATDPLASDYRTPALWAAGTSLTNDGNIYEGVLRNQTHYITAAVAGGLGLTRTAGLSGTAYRHLKAETKYNPWTNTGSKIVVVWSAGGTTEAGIRINEDFFTISGVGIFGDFIRRNQSAAAFKRLVYYESTFTRMWDCYLAYPSGGGSTVFEIPEAIWIDGPSGADKASNNYFYNVTVQGSGTRRGLTAGWNLGVNSQNTFCYNCTAVDIDGTGFLYPFTTTVTGPTLVNCIGANCRTGTFTGIAKVLKNGISSNVVSLDATWQNNVNPDSIWLNYKARDFRLRFGSPALLKGSNESAAFTAATGPGTNADPLGTARSAAGVTDPAWSIGPIESAYAPQNSSPPTTIIRSIGTTGFRDHFSMFDFLADMPPSLYVANQIWVAELYDDAEFVEGTTICFNYYEHVTTTQYKIVVRPASGQRYIPYDTTGARLRYYPNHSEVGYRANLWVTCNGTELWGFRTNNTADSAITDRNPKNIEAFGSNILIDGTYAIQAGNHTRQQGACIELDGEAITARNNIARGSGSAGTGAARGIAINRLGTRCEVLHNVVRNIAGANSTNQFGILLTAENILPRLSGNIVVDTAGTGAADFHNASSYATNAVMDHCISSDTTATGQNCFTNRTAASLFRDAANDDYRILGSSVAVNAGDVIAAKVPTDIAGKPRYSPLDIGVYEGIYYSELWATPAPTTNFRWARCVEIATRIGITRFFTDVNESIEHAGQRYLPIGAALRTTNRRVESGFRPTSMEIAGGINSNYIVDSDLAATLYRGGQVIIRIVDMKFPFTKPREVWYYDIESSKFDQRRWSMQLVSQISRLEQRVGHLNNPGCEFNLGDSNCGIDLGDKTEYSRSVTTVDLVRRQFRASAITSSRPDDYFGKGLVFWLTGSNRGLAHMVKTYTQTNRVVKLELATPFVIQVGDTFTMIPGCRKRFLTDCVTKWNNGRRSGADPFASGTDLALETPSR